MVVSLSISRSTFFYLSLSHCLSLSVFLSLYVLSFSVHSTLSLNLYLSYLLSLLSISIYPSNFLFSYFSSSPSIHSFSIYMSLLYLPPTYRVSRSQVSLICIIFYFTLCSHCTHVVGILRCCCLRECCQMVFFICV